MVRCIDPISYSNGLLGKQVFLSKSWAVTDVMKSFNEARKFCLYGL